MPRYTKYNCKYCAAKTCSAGAVCINCKEKLTVISRIMKFLADYEKTTKL